MKQFLALLLSSVMLLCLVSCGNDADKDTASSKNTSSKVQTSSEEDMTSSTIEVDTRYRATREEKPAGFKYKEARILILGDSITAGDGTPSGYRYSLFEQLYASGAKFRFVGAKQTTSDTRLPEKYSYHSSTGGWKIQTLIDNADTLCNFDYDIVLILIGRNDQDNTSGITDRYKTLLDTVLAKNPDASIYCGDVLPKRGTDISTDPMDTLFNKKLPEICEEYRAKGSKVNLVQMSKASWSTDMFGDSVHPNEKGNRQVANLFWDAILDEVLQINDSGDSSYVEPVHVNGLTISNSTLTLEVNNAKTITASVTPENAEVKNVLWSSSDEKIATVDENGKIKALAVGKAKITAKTLDGNITKVCELTVKESSEPQSIAVFTSNFDKTEVWQGEEKFITSSGFATSWATCSATPVITTANDVAVGNNFKMIFNYRVSGNVDSNSGQLGGYSKISFNGYEVRIYNCVRTIELYVDGASVGKYEPAAPSQERNTYTLTVLNGKVKLLFNGEEIISGNAGAGGDKKVSARIGDSPRCCTFSSISIKKF